MPPQIKDWERAEVTRSQQEALHTSAGWLRANEREVRRYLNPPLDSVFPLEYAFALLGDIRGLTVLDFGCGTGVNSLVLAKRGAHVIGIDISASLIELARRRLEMNGLAGATEFVVGSAHNLPISSQAVDLVVGIAVLHHLHLDLAAPELFRVLRNGGRAVFMEPVRDSRLLRAVRKLIPYRSPEVSPFERPLTSSELGEFATLFSVDSCRPFSLPFVNVAHTIGPLERHLDKVYRVDGELLKRFPTVAPLAGTRVFALSKRASASPRTTRDTPGAAQRHTTAMHFRYGLSSAGRG
jgi:SAM-dependent methyltransferase